MRVWKIGMTLLGMVLLCVSAEKASASPCDGKMINPVTDIAWQCIFPIRIGGVVQVSGNQQDSPDTTENALCYCDAGGMPTLGVHVSFWEPARIIDTVSEPWCLNAFGISLANTLPGTLDGSLGRRDGQAKAFQQMHYYLFPAWAVLDMFTDIPCLEETDFDVAMMTEVVPTWNNEVLSLIVNPESVLFANPAAALACAADATAAMVGFPLNQLFWCMGSWGMSYPLAGSITATDYVEANAGLAARGIFLMGRLGLLRTTTPDGCYLEYSPIWKKNRYRLQLMKPVRDSSCMPIGKTGVLWTAFKQPPVGGDNFSWMIFRKVDCCVSL